MTHEISPELALVDPSLREQLLAEPEPAPSVPATSAAEATPAAVAPAAAGDVTPGPTPEPIPAPPPPPSAPSPAVPVVVDAATVGTDAPVPVRRSRLRFVTGYSLLLLVLAAAGYGLVSLLHGGDARTTVPPTSSSIGRAAASPTATVARPTTTGRSATTHSLGTTSKTPPAKTTVAPAPRTLGFSWPAVHGATGYHVAFYAHRARDVLVYQTQTRAPRLVVRVRSGQGRPASALAPGSYLWYVWPIVGRRRSKVAIVSSKLQVR